MADGALAPGTWSSTIRIAPDEALRRTLLERHSFGPRSRSIWVTDLLDLRSAYWRRTAPVEPTAERRAVLEAGKELHVQIGHLLAPARYREVRRQRDGIVAQVDLLEDRPTEIKTTGTAPTGNPESDLRPSYVEQLGMYAALTDHTDGRLVIVSRSEDSPATSAVYDVSFPSLAPIGEEMVRRAGLLRKALEQGDPRDLPACRWRGRGCEYEAAGACRCVGTEADAGFRIRDLADPPRLDVESADRLDAALADAQRSTPPRVRKFRDLVYPRRCYFERRDSPALADPSPARTSAPDDLWRRLSELLELGEGSEVTREPVPSGVPLESVPCYRGEPYLIKVSRARDPIGPDEMVRAQPQYFLDLGLRCAALGVPSGSIILGYERASPWSEKIRTYRVTFDPLSTWDELRQRRAAAIDEAALRGEPGTLPGCPGWMYSSCAYRAVCDCGGAPPETASHR